MVSKLRSWAWTVELGLVLGVILGGPQVVWEWSRVEESPDGRGVVLNWISLRAGLRDLAVVPKRFSNDLLQELATLPFVRRVLPGKFWFAHNSSYYVEVCRKQGP